MNNLSQEAQGYIYAILAFVFWGLVPIDLSKATLQIVGGDVIATLPNGGQITFVSLGMMAFEANAPIVKLPSGMVMHVEQILNKIQDIGQVPKD